MSEPTRIYVLGELSPVQRERFRVAKSQLGRTDLFQFTPARPGCGRLISTGEEPGFACDYAVLTSEEQEDVTDAMAWYLGRPDPRATTMADWLSSVMNAIVDER